MRKTSILFLLVASVFLGGCVTYARPAARQTPTVTTRAPTPPTPREPRDEALFDGSTGREIDLGDFVRRSRGADVVVFGELHDHPIGARYQKELLEALAAQGRPIALAMEFFEADQQEDLDAYLAGTLDRETFLERTKRSPTYPKTHGPLVEWAKENGAPVIAANAPRRLVSAYRTFDGGYADYKASLDEEERSWLPDRTSTPEDQYWKNFQKVMGESPKAAEFFRSQALWDDAMAESIAEFRRDHPDHRVMFIVGGFHVRGRLGTITKYRARRAGDRLTLLLMEMDDDPTLPFQEEHRNAADAILMVPPPKRAPRTGPNPHAKPKNPHEKPPEVQP